MNKLLKLSLLLVIFHVSMGFAAKTKRAQRRKAQRQHKKEARRQEENALASQQDPTQEQAARNFAQYQKRVRKGNAKLLQDPKQQQAMNNIFNHPNCREAMANLIGTPGIISSRKSIQEYANGIESFVKTNPTIPEVLAKIETFPKPMQDLFINILDMHLNPQAENPEKKE